MSCLLPIIGYYVCENSKEKIFLPNNKTPINSLGDLAYTDNIGQCLCSILNSIGNVDNLFLDIKKNYVDIYSIDISNNLESIFTKLCEVNFAYKFCYQFFLDCTQRINKRFHQKIQEGKIFDKNKDDFINIYIEELDKLLYTIKNASFLARTCIELDSNTIFLLPASQLKFDLKNPTKKEKNILNNTRIKSYTYTIHNLNDLIKCSYYQVLLNNYHIKKCKYPNCNKYFTTPFNQTRFCDNPCPADPRYTCKKIRKTISQTDDSECFSFEFDLEEINQKYSNLNQFFSDSCKRKKYKSKKNHILSNKKKLNKYVKQIKIIIKGAPENEKMKYLKIYETYINQIYSNAKEGNFKVFPIIIPSNKKM